MILADQHTHSVYSTDSEAELREMADAALRAGLRALTFTDHLDYEYPSQSDTDTFTFDVASYLRTLSALRAEYAPHLTIRIGAELGLRAEPALLATLPDRYRRLTEQTPFDFLIGSLHVVDGFDPYYPDFWADKTAEEGVLRYFEEMLTTVRAYDCFHVYGHLDYITRYIPNIGARPAPREAESVYVFETYRPLLETLLTTLLAKGKGIELNTSALRKGFAYPHPRRELLALYRALGGEVITIGSDAHLPQDVAADFACARDLLLSLGYRYYAEFEAGVPHFVKL